MFSFSFAFSLPPPAKYFICFGACFKFYYPRNSTLRRFVHVLILYGYSNQDGEAKAVSPYSSSLPSITSIHLDGRSFTWPPKCPGPVAFQVRYDSHLISSKAVRTTDDYRRCGHFRRPTESPEICIRFLSGQLKPATQIPRRSPYKD